MLHGWISLLVGLALASIAVIQAGSVLRNASRDRAWTHVRAEVVSSRTSYGQGDRRSTIVTYAFLADDGRSRIGHGTVSEALPTGTGIDVLYDPADPRSNQLRRRPGLAYVGPGLLGLLCLAVGIFGIVNGLLELTQGRGIE